ncbi:SPRY-domain-containing protein, partial [Rhodotorula sp. JG-1b]
MQTLAILIPLIVVSTVLLLLLFFTTALLLHRRRRGIELADEGGPTNLEREDRIDGEGGLDGVEARWLQTVDEPVKMGYVRAKIWQTQYPPDSQPTEITLSQFLSIQEKGVSAWSFEPDYESNPAIIVESRTEITFLADGQGMAPEEGGGCSVQSNLPVPKLNDVYYFECKMYEKPSATNVSIGLATKPYPSFRMPGMSRYSVGYHSQDGFKSHSFPFTATSYGPALLEGDTLGVGYRPRTGTVFFTRNGKKLEDAFVGFNKRNVFPTIGADGPCSVHVNLGQAGFVFIEANVKKWGLAPMMGTLAPPPAYGSERGSILLE